MPRLVRVEGLGVVRFPDLLPAHEVSRAINTHLATRPAAPASSQPQRQTLVGPPGNRLGGNSVVGQMGDIGHAALSAIGIEPFGPEDVGAYETVDTKRALPGNRAQFQTTERKIGMMPDMPGKPGKSFYSALEKAIDSKMPAQASIQQVMGIIENPKNAIKAGELEWTGVKDWLMDRAKQDPKVSKDELLDYVRSHNAQLEEVTKGEAGHYPEPLKWTDPYMSGQGRKTWTTNIRDRAYVIRETPDGLYHLKEIRETGDHSVGTFSSVEHAKARAQQVVADPTKYSNYAMPGAQNYREMLLTVPKQQEKVANTIAMEHFGRDWMDLSSAEKADVRAIFESQQKTYKSAHWDEPNVLAHMRISDRLTPDKKKVLMAEEVQSDWHQAGRKKGYTNTKADLEFTKLHARWESLSYERAVMSDPQIRHAVEAGSKRFPVYDRHDMYLGSYDTQDEAIAAVNQALKESYQEGRNAAGPVQYRDLGRDGLPIGEGGTVDAKAWKDRLDENTASMRDLTERMNTVRPGPLKDAEKKELALLTDRLTAGEELPRELKDRYTELMDRKQGYFKKRDEVPDAPFKGNWHELSLKRLLRKAVDEGYDALAWTPADVHTARWGTERASWARHAENPSGAVYTVEHTPAREASATGRRPAEADVWRVIANGDRTVTGYSTAAQAEEAAAKLNASHFGEPQPAGPMWNFKYEPQVGGDALGGDLGEEAIARGLVNRTGVNKVRSLQDVKDIIQFSGDSRMHEPEDIDALAEKIWKRMQESPEAGLVQPRKEGFETNYNTKFRSFLNQYTKKWGGKVVPGEVVTGAGMGDVWRFELEPLGANAWALRDNANGRTAGHVFNSPAEAEAWIAEQGKPKTAPAHMLDITPEMRKSVLEGQPLWSVAPIAIGAGAAAAAMQPDEPQ